MRLIFNDQSINNYELFNLKNNLKVAVEHDYGNTIQTNYKN